jgi:beta-phosphoglucomutase-like phosphatase (HAD superfamily)
MVNSISIKPTAGFIFDMDGTMIDNMRFHTDTWRQLLAERDLDIDMDEFQRHTSGKPTFDILRDMFGHELTEEEIKTFAERKELLYRDFYRPHLKAVAGLHVFLSAAREFRMALAVASSARRRNIGFVLED